MEHSDEPFSVFSLYAVICSTVYRDNTETVHWAQREYRARFITVLHYQNLKMTTTYPINGMPFSYSLPSHQDRLDRAKITHHPKLRSLALLCFASHHKEAHKLFDLDGHPTYMSCLDVGFDADFDLE
eukprot:sb/3475447/